MHITLCVQYTQQNKTIYNTYSTRRECIPGPSVYVSIQKPNGPFRKIQT